ncbi:hypothetical protein ISN45_Aa07g020560 [Arabidopsis thaliana x Arabidopsis arenosa]|uniref:Retrotransposon gag domain-containing protein n=1 Tax=Arabidopsis thaliana x Arabidopsis arenosa TaxID=1240361 RepID=A0A8T1Y4K6_9BRAS|nr:hypothetical protein ISN45_Aa07g020560 [Arabidopsis thaliana x Arabidopsis arenosa]
MADATRLQTLSKQSDEQRQATEVITTQIAKLTQSQAQIDKLLQLQQKMEAMMEALMSQRSSQLSRPPDPPYSASGDLTSYSQAPQPPDPPDFNRFGQKLSKFEFPKFDGTLVREWFRRCDEYFSLHKTPPEMRVRVASSHMIGKALQWHTDYIRNDFGIFPPWLDYIMAISAKFGDDDALPMHRAPFNPYYKNPYATSLLPATETIETPLSKPDFTPKSYDEIQARSTKELSVFDEEPYIRDHQLKYKQSQTFVKECEDASMSGDEANHETNSVLEKEIPSSASCQRVPATLSQNNNVTQQGELNYDMETIMGIGLVQEQESLGLTDSVLEIDCVHSQEFSSQFQVPIPSLEPSRRRHKDSPVVVNDLSYDHGCVIGKTIGSICDSELGQDNPLDEEEFKGLKLGKLSKNKRQLSIVCLLGIMGMSCWTQFSSLHKANEMSLRERARWKRSEKQRTYNKAWKFKYAQRFMLSVLLQNEQHKLLQGRNIKCKMRKMEVLRRIKQSLFIEVQFDMKNSERMSLELVNFQANTRDAEIETTLIDRDTFENPLEDSYKACAHGYISLGVLELIKDKASRKRKLCKNWWFKYKLNTWFSEALHFWRKRKYEKMQRVSEDMVCELIYKTRKACHCVVHETNLPASHVWYGWKTKVISPFLQKRYRRYGSMLGLTQELHHTGFVKIMQTFSPMLEDTHWDKETWVKLNPESCKGGSLLEFLKRHEARFDMIKVPNNTKFFNSLKFLVKSYILRIEDSLKGCKFVKFTMEQSEKPLITILSYEWFHLPRPPELSCCKEDEESTTKFSSLRTRMF